MRERERENERERDVREKHRSVASLMHLDRGSNPQGFGCTRRGAPPPSQGEKVTFQAAPPTHRLQRRHRAPTDLILRNTARAVLSTNPQPRAQI